MRCSCWWHLISISDILVLKQKQTFSKSRVWVHEEIFKTFYRAESMTLFNVYIIVTKIHFSTRLKKLCFLLFKNLQALKNNNLVLFCSYIKIHLEMLEKDS